VVDAADEIQRREGALAESAERNRALIAALAEREAVIAEARAALEHYACKCWANPMPDCAQGDLRDCGHRARAALAHIDAMKGGAD
jgi:hypothetical protein